VDITEITRHVDCIARVQTEISESVNWSCLCRILRSIISRYIYWFDKIKNVSSYIVHSYTY